jgi:hypothetical protein
MILYHYTYERRLASILEKADMCSALGHVRFVPIADIAIIR